MFLISLIYSMICYADTLTIESNTAKHIESVSFLDSQNKARQIHTIYTSLTKHKDIADTKQWYSLLHYENNKSLINKKSHFFISPKGYINPLAEYNAFIYSILLEELHALYRVKNQSYNDDKSLICQYPARLNFIATQLQGIERKRLLDYIDTKKCIGLQTFYNRASFDFISLEFAGESDINPNSAMGHIYLSTQESFHADRAYTISFFATTNLGFNPINYIRVFIGGVRGHVVLMPAKSARSEYLDDEKRTLYRFKLLLNTYQKRLLQQHLWELKDKEIHYKFITYNCNTAMRKILGVANRAFDIRNKKILQTPTEYLSLLHKQGLITQQDITLPEKKQEFVKRHGENNVLDTKKNSRLSFSYAGFTPFVTPTNHHLQIEFNPIYIDGRNADTAYKEFMEAKLAAFSVGLDSITLQPYINKLELLRLKSVLDIAQTRSFSKLMNISFESNLYQPDNNGGFLAVANTSSHIMPTIEFGLGIGKYTKHTRWYILPRIGYRYEVIHNVYMGFEGGVITSFRWRDYDFKGIFNYTYFYDFMDNNRGYDGMFYAYFGMAVLKNIDIFIESKYYHTLLQTSKIPYEATELLQYNTGIAWYF